MNDYIDILDVSKLVCFERHWRDTGQWDKMRSAYHPDSQVRVSWFEGSGFAFVDASQSIHREGQSKHRLSPPLVRLNGEHALTETTTVIETRTQIDGIEVDTTAHCRLVSRLRRDDGVWRLASLDAIYEKDMIAPVHPADRLNISAEDVQAYRPSYKFLCYALRRGGRSANQHLPGDDRPDLVAALYKEAEDWLLNGREPTAPISS